MSTHILEVLLCASALTREQYRAEIEKSGAVVVDEKINFTTKSTKFYLTLKSGDKGISEESLVIRIKTSGLLSEKCTSLVRITRGTDKTKSLL